MFEEIKKETKQKMSQSIEHAKSEFLKVRTGRANPDLLNSIQVEYYGTMTPLNQVSTITVPEPRMISLHLRAFLANFTAQKVHTKFKKNF